MKGLQTSCFFYKNKRSAWHFHAISAGLPRKKPFSQSSGTLPNPSKKFHVHSWRDVTVEIMRGTRGASLVAIASCLACWTMRCPRPGTFKLSEFWWPPCQHLPNKYRGWRDDIITHLYWSRLFECCLKNVLNEEFDVCDFIDLTSKLG